MNKQIRLKIAILATAVVAVVGGGAAVAATQLSPAEQSDAIVADAAKQLGVDSSKLDAALTKALQNQVDAAVADGRLTEEQGEAMKERIASDDFPLVGVGPGGPGGPGHGHHALDFSAAATYLGLTDEELRTALMDDGKTLAEVAEAEGKSVDGLVDALVAAAKERLDEAVADGRITAAERTAKLAELEARIEDAVENGLPGPHGPRGGMMPPAVGSDA